MWVMAIVLDSMAEIWRPCFIINSDGKEGCSSADPGLGVSLVASANVPFQKTTSDGKGKRSSP